MNKIINNQIIKMVVILTLLTMLCVWQINFIMMAINANIYMNGAIILAFMGSAALAIHMVYKLKKETLAIDSLKELWSDAHVSEKQSLKDPYWKHYRALENGQVFYQPKILGHAYDLVSEEIQRTGKMKIGVGTVETLMHKIEAKLSDERALINYLSGLLVFMGLIGAFLGLLKMVGSISGIIGSLAAATGSGGAADAFQKMLNDLQQPLSGMATGFASSLFGLFCSLVIGLMGRFAAQAQNSLKHEFESLLVGIAQIDNSEAATGSSLQSTENQLNQEAILTFSLLVQKTNQALEQSNTFMETIAANQAIQTEAMKTSAEHFANVAFQQTALQAHIIKISEIGQSLSALKQDIGRFESSIDEKVSHSLAQLSGAIEKSWSAQSHSVAQLAQHQAQLVTAINKTVSEKHMQMPQTDNHKVMEAGLAQGFDKVARVLDATTRSVAQSLNQMAQQQAQYNQVIAKQSAQMMHVETLQVPKQLEPRQQAPKQSEPLQKETAVHQQQLLIAQNIEEYNQSHAKPSSEVAQREVSLTAAQLEQMKAKFYEAARNTSANTPAQKVA